MIRNYAPEVKTGEILKDMETAKLTPIEKSNKPRQLDLSYPYISQIA